MRAKGVLSVTNAILHPWLQEQFLSILENEEETRKQEDRKPAPAFAHGGSCGVPPVGNLAGLEVE